MPQSFTQIYIHFTCHTKNNYPFLNETVSEKLYHYIAGILKNLNSIPIQIGGVNDHIHVLFTLPKTISTSKMAEEIKRSSSKWIKTQGASLQKFYWQDGYGAFSVSSSKLESVKNYILKQKEHHKKISFLEEYKLFLKEYNIPFDESYL